MYCRKMKQKGEIQALPQAVNPQPAPAFGPPGFGFWSVVSRMKRGGEHHVLSWNVAEFLCTQVFESLPPKEDGEGCVMMEVPGTLKEATTQEALQRGTVRHATRSEGLWWAT